MVWLFQNKIFKGIFNTIKIVFFILLIFYSIFIGLLKYSNYHSIFGYRIYSISSNSMKKVYRLYDVVLVKKVKKNSLKEGVDILYLGERGGLKGKRVLHRIVKIEKDDKGKFYYTQGVSSPTIDPSIQEEQIIGKAIGRVLILSEANHLLKNQYGFFFLIFCPLVLLIMIELLKTITDMKVEKGRLLETDRLSLTEVIKIKKRSKGKKSLENTYHDIPLIVETIPLDSNIEDNDKEDEKEKENRNKKEDKKTNKKDKNKKIKKMKIKK
ncbi:MAG: signal peptidase I [Bacilli bacterium]|nr:signal peptidase I [Bacilli bacterium]